MRHIIIHLTMAILLVLGSSSVCAQCYQSNCRTDDDGTVWCNNQEVPCDSIDLSASTAEALNVQEVEPINTSYTSDDTVDLFCPVCGPSHLYEISYNPALGIFEENEVSAPSDRAPLELERHDEPATVSFRNGTYGDHSDWYNIGD
jgi:hypothetical protein